MMTKIMADDLLAQYHALLRSINPSEPPAPPPQVSQEMGALESAVAPHAEYSTRPTIVEIELDSDDEFDRQALEQHEPRDQKFVKIRTKNEIPLEELDIDPLPRVVDNAAPRIPVCIVHHHSGDFSIAAIGGGCAVEPGSLLVDKENRPVTRVLDLFGKVDDPWIILKGKFDIGMELYSVMGEYAIPDPDTIESMYKGSDASNRDDEPERPAFSDDEEEREFLRKEKESRKAELCTRLIQSSWEAPVFKI